ncbi:MAG: DMT family transporter [Neomegalonema sp.]|nr:DMT family transporter [Neomegalonema sp.]
MFPPALWRLAALVFVAVTAVVVGDTAGKLMTAGGVDPAFVAWTRFLLAALILAPFSGVRLHELPHLLRWRVALRAGFICCGIFCILTALKTEPIANVFGAFFVGPIVSYILATLFLGERPTATRSALLAIGFAGVMLVVKPGVGVSVGMLFALAAGVFYGAYLAMTRLVAGDYRPRFLLISQLIIGALALTPIGASAEIPELTPYLCFLIAVSALGSAVGNYILVIANRQAEASLIAPLVYSQLFSATILGVVVFRDWPDLLSLLGLVLIAFSGFASLRAHFRTKAPVGG